ncbi:MAG TPA: GNAT family N-acetyltransferase [Methylomirabilota bacterium]|nr:GNAT family N-acetyltransferase [Methylomirabilota bacterium]
MEPDRFLFRDARDADSEQLIALIGAVYAEYPGCVLDVDGEMPHLRRPASAFAELGGRLWAVERDGRIVGAIGFTDQAGVLEMRHLYVAAGARRHGLGRRLCALVEEAARRRGRREVELWSDTRFREAHRLYERLGYVRGPEIRELGDLSHTVEYRYRKAL